MMGRRSHERARGTCGQVLPVVGIMLVALVCAVALAVDLSGAYRMEAAQRQELELAKDSVMGDLVALKFSDADPASAPWVADVGDALFADGFRGDFRVWWVELPESLTGPLDRLVVMRVELSQTYEDGLSQAMGVSDTPVSSTITFWANPYSSQEVWRPSGSGEESRLVYDGTVGDGGWTATHRSCARSALPEDVIDSANEGLSQLSGGGPSSGTYAR